MNENAAIYCHAHALAPLLVRLGAPRVQYTVVESVRTDSTVVSCTRGARVPPPPPRQLRSNHGDNASGDGHLVSVDGAI